MLSFTVFCTGCVQVWLILMLWIYQSKFVQSTYYKDQLLKSRDPLSGLPDTVYSLLGLWLTLVMLYIIPSLFEYYQAAAENLFPSHASSGGRRASISSTTPTNKPRTAAPKQKVVEASMFQWTLFLLACWVRIVCVSYIAWYAIIQAQSLDSQAAKLEYAGRDSDQLWRESVSLSELMYTIFGYGFASVIVLIIDQNYTFFKIGQASKR